MVILDFVIITCVAGIGILGFKRGFIKELVETLGALLSALAAYRYHEQFAEFVGVSATSTLISKLLSFFGLFILIMIILSVVGHLLKKFIRAINLGLYERLAGFILGIIKAGIIVSVLTLAVIWTGGGGQKLVAESKYARANLLIFDFIAKALPDPFYNKYKALVEGVISKASQSQDNLRISEIGLTGQEIVHLKGTMVSFDDAAKSGKIEYLYAGREFSIDVSSSSLSNSIPKEIKGELPIPVRFEIGYDPLSASVFAIKVECLNNDSCLYLETKTK